MLTHANFDQRDSSKTTQVDICGLNRLINREQGTSLKQLSIHTSVMRDRIIIDPDDLICRRPFLLVLKSLISTDWIFTSLHGGCQLSWIYDNDLRE
jgi:hypothetical protein